MSEATQLPRHGTPDRPAQRRPLRERREKRAANSRNAQDAMWRERFEQVSDPLELLQRGYELIRTRVVQRLKRAEQAVDRAKTAKDKQAAAARLESARAEVERVCGSAVEHLERLAAGLDTTRR